ncbi:MAG: permease [Verrucomicrobiota bacterium]
MSWFNFSFHDFAVSFLSVVFEGIPFLLLGALISGLVDVFVSADRVTRLLPGRSGPAIFASGLLGLIFPICECGSVIVIRRFLKKGLPLSCATAYMLGAPIVSPIVALSTWEAFGQSVEPGPLLMVSLRLGIGYMLAVAVAFLVHHLPHERILQPGIIGGARRRGGLSITSDPGTEKALPQEFTDLVATASMPRRLLMAVQSATADFLDVAFYFVIGAAITCLFNTGVRQEVLAPLAASPLLGISSLMVLAAMLGLCSTTDAFIAWTFTSFSSGAKLAFLLFGPMFDFKLLWLYGLVFQKRFVLVFAIGLFIVIALLCWRLDALQVFGGRVTMPPTL